MRSVRLAVLGPQLRLRRLDQLLWIESLRGDF